MNALRNHCSRVVLGVLVGGWLSLILAGCSLAADVTPPPDAQSFVAAQPTPTGEALPLIPPDPRQGEAIYREKCAPCHGEQGMGDGPQAAQLPVPVPALADPQRAREANPVAWYRMVTEGNIERYMPGFRSLSERQRWDVVAYVLSLSLSSSSLQRGAEIYAQHCQSCHGPEGKGDGPQAATLSVTIPNWRSEPGILAGYSLRDIFVIIQNGLATGMPAFGEMLSEADTWAAAEYIRSLSFASGSMVSAPVEAVTPPVSGTPGSAAVPTPMTTPPSSLAFVTVKGQVNNATLGTPLADTEVRLLAFDGMTTAFERSTRTDAQGRFTFDEVEIQPSRILLATVDYQGLSFESQAYHIQAQDLAAPDQPIDLSIAVYETTTDPAVLQAERMHVFLDVLNQERLQVVELLLYTNTRDRVLIAKQPGDPVFTVAVPAGAENLQFQDGALGERYIETPNGFGDTEPVYPGMNNQLLFAYELPLARQVSLAIPVPMPVEAAVIMVPQEGITLSGPRLQAMGTRQVQGMTLQVYTASALEAGSTLNLTLSLRQSLPWRLNLTTGSGLVLGLTAFILVALGLGWWYWRQTRLVQAPEPVEVEADDATAILDAIIALDDLYWAGELPEEAYRARREELKARLRALQSREG